METDATLGGPAADAAEAPTGSAQVSPETTSPGAAQGGPGYDVTARPLAVVTLAAGFWVLFAPLILDYASYWGAYTAALNDTLVGLALIALALVRLLGTGRFQRLAGLSVLAAIWLAIAPAALGFADQVGMHAAVWNDSLAGVLIAIVATIGLVAPLRLRKTGHDRASM